jgi:hypothetical protein
MHSYFSPEISSEDSTWEIRVQMYRNGFGQDPLAEFCEKALNSFIS